MSFEGEWSQFRAETEKRNKELSLASSEGAGSNRGENNFKYEETALRKAKNTISNQIQPQVTKASRGVSQDTAEAAREFSEWAVGGAIKKMQKRWNEETTKLGSRIGNDARAIETALSEFQSNEQEVKRQFTKRGDARINRPD